MTRNRPPVLVAFAVDGDGETIVELRARKHSRRRLKVTAKYLARQVGRPFAVGVFVAPKEVAAEFSAWEAGV